MWDVLLSLMADCSLKKPLSVCYRVGQVKVAIMPHDGEDKLIPIIQKVIELPASSQGGRWLDPIEVSSCGEDELFASVIRAVGHLAAVPVY